MNRMTTGRRITAGMALGAASVLAVGAAPARASEDPVRQEIKVVYSSAASTGSSCVGSEVWGVAAGKDSPESKRGNYQVCRYATNAVGADLGDVPQELTDRATAAVHQAAGGPSLSAINVYCTYYMPTGPNRSASVSYNTKKFVVTVIDHYASGASVVSHTGLGWHHGGPKITWSPQCNTH